MYLERALRRIPEGIACLAAGQPLPIVVRVALVVAMLPQRALRPVRQPVQAFEPTRERLVEKTEVVRELSPDEQLIQELLCAGTTYGSGLARDAEWRKVTMMKIGRDPTRALRRDDGRIVAPTMVALDTSV